MSNVSEIQTRPAEPVQSVLVEGRNWWQQLPSDVRLAVHLVAFTIIVSSGVGAVMGAWLLWVLARA